MLFFLLCVALYVLIGMFIWFGAIKALWTEFLKEERGTDRPIKPSVDVMSRLLMIVGWPFVLGLFVYGFIVGVSRGARK